MTPTYAVRTPAVPMNSSHPRTTKRKDVMGKKKAASKLAVAAGAAKVQAHDLQERITPAVEDARDRLAPRIAEARDRIGPAVEDARDRLAPHVTDARERLAPHVADARERLAPHVADARERWTPLVEDARERLTPVVDDARDRLADLAENVATRLDDALPDDRTPALVKNASANRSGGSRVKKLLVVTGLGTVAFVVAKRLRGGSEPQWQSTAPVRPVPSSATPTASEQAASAAGAPAAAVAGLVSADEATPNPDADDAGGGTPDEVAADAVESPHVPTTPDNPAETIQLDKE